MLNVDHHNKTLPKKWVCATIFLPLHVTPLYYVRFPTNPFLKKIPGASFPKILFDHAELYETVLIASPFFTHPPTQRCETSQEPFMPPPSRVTRLIVQSGPSQAQKDGPIYGSHWVAVTAGQLQSGDLTSSSVIDEVGRYFVFFLKAHLRTPNLTCWWKNVIQENKEFTRSF